MTPPGSGPRRPRVLATDLDGTLLGPGAAVTPRTVEVLRAAHDTGIRIVAATGRSHRTAGPKVAPVGVIDRAICSNGAMVVRLDPLVVEAHTPIPAPLAPAVVAALRNALPDVGLGWEHLDGWAWDPAWVAQRPPTDGEAVGEVAVDPPAGTDLVKVLVTHPDLTHDPLLDAVGAVLPDGVVASTSGAAFVEITAEGADKGVALAALCRRWGVDRADVVAFGDHRNDLGMLAWAGWSVAMGNAHPDVLSVVDEVAPPNTADGVAAVVERWC